MKILAIRGRNLTSLAGEFAVELAQPPLSGAGIFAITGPTGAGKSTLLDALCLALFNRTPRLAGRNEVKDEHDVSATDPRQTSTPAGSSDSTPNPPANLLGGKPG